MSINYKNAMPKAAAIIQANHSLFKPGSTITDTQFCAIVGVPRRTSFNDCFDHLRYIKKLGWHQSVLNRILAMRGLYLRSSGKCTSFHVHNDTETITKVINRNERMAHNATVRAATMQAGATMYSKWTKLGTKELSMNVEQYKHVITKR